MDISQKKDKVLNALIEHKGIQSITDIGEEVLGNPLFIYDISGKILAKSSSMEAVSVWKNLIPDDYLDAEKLHLAEQGGAIERILSYDDPVIAKFPYSPYRVMGCRIRDKDSAVGISTVVELHKIKEEDKDLLVMISKTILFELLYRERTAMQTIPYFNLLKDIIEETDSEGSIRERCNVLKLKIPQDMILLGIKFSGKRENSLSLFYIRQKMMTILPSSLCIIYDGSLLIILDKKHFRKDLIDQIKNAFSNYEMRIGVSRLFHDIMDIKHAFKEMQAIQNVYMKLGIERPVTYYDEIVLYHFMELASHEYDLKEFLDPSIRALQEYDRMNGSFLCESVEAYLEAGRNIQKAADIMHMHKNTLYYRLKKAEDIAQINLDDENICFNLQLSFRMNRMAK
ncbi:MULTISPECIES: PucR family transcriptional regulator [unclassified Bilifractor]|uniref:PucR family transcriptional regulator n=1 Tax=unclassified Bilifractor TaxID=2815795 RepID=UPI003F90C7B7